MSAQGDCEFLVQRARELVQKDLWAAKAWLITARSLYPADFNIQVRFLGCPGSASAWPGGWLCPLRRCPLVLLLSVHQAPNKADSLQGQVPGSM